MTIRQSIAAFYMATALLFLAAQTVPALSSAVSTLALAVELSAGKNIGMTGHPEIDDLPAYLTDENGHAEF